MASIIDTTLVVLAALTLALIAYKAFSLWLPAREGSALWALKTARDDAERDLALEQLESGLTLLATVASAAPFLGLAGTVLHIIEALGRLGAGADVSAITAPMAHALNSTLLGLAAAIPAAIAYNLMQRRITILSNRVVRASTESSK